MNALSAIEIARMKSTQAETMRDTCRLGTLTVDATGAYSVETISWGSVIACGYSAGGGNETGGGAQAPTNAATLRLPQSTAVVSTSHVRIVTVAGTALSPAVEHRVIGAPEFGPTAITLRLSALPVGGTG